LSPSSRERVLWEIAESYSELVDPSFGPSGVRGSGELGLRMPWSYTGTVREFERLQQRLRVEDAVLGWHLLEWHLKAERVTRLETVTVLRGRRRVQLRHPDGSLVMRRTVTYRRHPGAVEGRWLEEERAWASPSARAAVAWIATRFEFEPEIPVHPEELRERRLAAQRAAAEERRRRTGVEEVLEAVA
jgi:hypothetical protein